MNGRKLMSGDIHGLATKLGLATKFYDAGHFDLQQGARRFAPPGSAAEGRRKNRQNLNANDSYFKTI